MCRKGNHWLRVHLQGNASGTDGLGAKIEVTAGGKNQVRKVVSGASFMGQNMLDAHFGIGEADEIVSVTVYWPSGQVQRITDVGVDGCPYGGGAVGGISLGGLAGVWKV